MAEIVQITGKPATRKSTSLMTLDPSKTVFFDADGKHLPWAGAKKVYNAANKNYAKTDSWPVICSAMARLIRDRPEVEVFVIDTTTAILDSKVIEDKNIKTWSKWDDYSEMAEIMYRWVKDTMPENKIVIFIAHAQAVEETDAFGNRKTVWTTKSAGQSTKKKELNKYLNYNIYTDVDEEAESLDDKFVFVTQNIDGTTEARSKFGVLPIKMKPDMAEVIRLIKEKDWEVTEE